MANVEPEFAPGLLHGLARAEHLIENGLELVGLSPVTGACERSGSVVVDLFEVYLELGGTGEAGAGGGVPQGG